MRIQTLIATMNLSDHDSLVQSMNISGESITINQSPNSNTPNSKVTNHKLLSYSERGLSRSRNRAIDTSDSDICVIADDDMRYEDNYEEQISKAYNELPQADIIAFHVGSEDPRQNKKILKKGRLNRITSMKIASWQLTFRRDSITKSGIRFDENFGAGTHNYMGEENIFLYDCIRRGLKVYYMPIKIATLQDDAESTWFEGYNKKYFTVKGAAYRRMSTALCLPFIIQFALRKYTVYKNTVSLYRAVFYMINGAAK